MTVNGTHGAGSPPRVVRPVLGPEATRLDDNLAAGGLPVEVRSDIWASAQRILAHGPTASGVARQSTGIAIGYVQSGKTTAFTALIARAADAGYRVVVAMLGSTTLLLDQNSRRLAASLDLETRVDYRWITLENPNLDDITPRELEHYISRGRLVLVTLLKHSGRIDQAARVLTERSIGGLPVLIVDDEADQVSLNTRVRQGEESPTYAAVGRLRANIGPHLYVQYTATPYAPLLLEVEDFLSPDFVEILQPGPGYVGGLELLVQHRDTVARVIVDSPGVTQSPRRIPASLRDALGEFVVGAALLLGADRNAAPVSMLIHPSGRKDIHRRYEFLVDRALRLWRADHAAGRNPDDVDFGAVRTGMVRDGCQNIADEVFDAALGYVLGEVSLWRVNSADDANRTVRWNLSPVHVLIGGNKLDRGFTVEGLTVSWLGRQPSIQLDTMVQRARAYGYRAKYLPYCRFYASADTLDALTSGVDTELDMRARIRDWVDEGRPVREWAQDMGLVIGSALRPTRAQVLKQVEEFRSGWHFLSRPSTEISDTHHNMASVESIGLVAAPETAYGRLRHRTLSGVDPATIIRVFLDEWALQYSPGWDMSGLKSWLLRLSPSGKTLPVLWMTGEGGGPRERAWDERLGFDQLMQGPDPVQKRSSAYAGDRNLLPGIPHIQVHYVRQRNGEREPQLALAVHALDAPRIVRRGRAATA